ncbi:hypothetical protein GQ54DRAFT_298992 [Martensiomyces pterosporus]|nr:hypothetical protein GQ54DRAFT_298992 [Martensiomyces pterosporus]
MPTYLTAVLLYLLCALLPSQSAHGSSSDLVDLLNKRDVDRNAINAVSTGILVKNGNQTSCELIPVDSRAGFLAASCLDFVGKQVDNRTAYWVYIQDTNLNLHSNFTLEKIHVHPLFDPNTYANNIAVVEYNSKGALNWTSPVAMDKSSWTETVYSRRIIRDMDQMRWNLPSWVSSLSTNLECKNASGLYATNTGSFVCGNWTLTSPLYNKVCTIPYATVYAAVGDTLAVAGVYSHTAIYGADICSVAHQLSYYTLLSPYVSFANSVLNRTLDMFTSSSKFEMVTDPNYSMRASAPTNISGMTEVGGDLYTIPAVKQKTPSSSSIASTQISSELSAAGPTSSLLTASPTVGVEQPFVGTSGSTSGLTRAQTVIVATVVPVTAIFVTIGLFFVYKKYKKSRNVATWDPRAERSNFNAENIARDLGSSPASPRHTMLPAYADVEFIDALFPEAHARASEDSYHDRVSNHSRHTLSEKTFQLPPLKFSE